MTNADTVTELRFEPPAPGYWERDAVHFPRPMTRYWQEVHPAAFARGTGDFARFYGMLMGSLGSAYVHGFGYRSMVPVAEEEVPARFQRASEVMQGKLWREQLRDWDERVKPDSIKAHRAVQSVDPASPLRPGAGRVSDALPRPPRSDDRAAHALHGLGRRPDRGFPGARGRLDGRAAG